MLSRACFIRRVGSHCPNFYNYGGLQHRSRVCICVCVRAYKNGFVWGNNFPEMIVTAVSCVYVSIAWLILWGLSWNWMCCTTCCLYTRNVSPLCTPCTVLCGLVVRVLGYRSGGPGSIPGTTRKKSSGSGTGCTQPREYNWGATW
jgi:hypothetical protein